MMLSLLDKLITVPVPLVEIIPPTLFVMVKPVDVPEFMVVSELVLVIVPELVMLPPLPVKVMLNRPALINPPELLVIVKLVSFETRIAFASVDDMVPELVIVRS